MNVAQEQHALTIKDLARATGLSISTLRRRVRDGSLPALQLGGKHKQLTFSPTILDELFGRIGGQEEQPSGGPSKTADHTLTTPSAEPSPKRDGITRPKSGPIPNWMRSPLLTKSNSTNS